MQIESVRALKEELRLKVVAPYISQALDSGTLGIRTQRLAVSAAPHTLGLGITTKVPANDDFQLAIRIQHPRLRNSPLISRIINRARGEVDVRFIGRIHPHEKPWYQDSCRPLLIGGSIAHYSLTAGTLGAFVRDRLTGQVCVLSNNHVLANENNAAPGDVVLQPGYADGGSIPGDIAATLTRFVPLQFPGPNLVDAAIATIGAGITENLAALDNLGVLRGLRATPLICGEPVSKLGRSSGRTNGTIKTVELASITLDYDQGSATFDDQIEIEAIGPDPFSIGGDSGSLVVDSDQQGLGLLCGGSDNGALQTVVASAMPTRSARF